MLIYLAHCLNPQEATCVYIFKHVFFFNVGGAEAYNLEHNFGLRFLCCFFVLLYL